MGIMLDGLLKQIDPLPLRIDDGGVLRVGDSRVTLDLIVEQYHNGMSPEDMVRAYDTLLLADVHAVISFYLRHHQEVDTYLQSRKEEAELLRVAISQKAPRVSPTELLARKAIGSADAVAGH